MNLFQITVEKHITENPIASQFPMHAHDGYEIYIFLSGSSEYSVEGNIYQLFPGDIMILNKNEAHHPLIKKPLPYTRLYINFNPLFDVDDALTQDFLTIFTNKPAGLNNHYSAKHFPNNHWDFYFNNIYHTEDDTQRQVFLMALLLELKKCSTDVTTQTTNCSTNNVYQITQYIDRHLTHSLSLEIICERFFISPSQLNRNFKKNLGITVGEYITTKRLLLAHDLLNQGQMPSHIYKKCGFHDYSTFFRAYKKKFGYSPKKINPFDFCHSSDIYSVQSSKQYPTSKVD
ncbi:MAG: helix-turn-helix transcriptional regulator [Lachnospiraceae bacterium]|nr:helix-turn-helix transcriptional regulator [Lachnospiraceae bacterium]